MMLRSGIGYRQFAELAKVAFVREALGERDNRGRTTNLSRVAIRTGLSRKEVSRLRDRLQDRTSSSAGSVEQHYHSGHAARVLQLWHADPRFASAKGVPFDLPFAGDELSFCSIVRAVGGDVPPGAVRAELVDAKAVLETHEGLLRPVKRYFVPANVGEELLVGFTHFVAPVLEGLARNTDQDCDQPFIQRLAYSDRLISTAIPLFREVARDKAESFAQYVDDWLSANEVRPESDAPDSIRVGLGVFYYEDDVRPESATLGKPKKS
jgi:hypothetical protein